MSQSAKRFDTQVSLFNYLKKTGAQSSFLALSRAPPFETSDPVQNTKELLQNGVAPGRRML